MKKYIYIIILFIYAIFVLFVGIIAHRHGYMMCVCGHEIHEYNVAQYRLDREKEFSQALKKGLRWQMENDSVLWNSAFVKTREYQKIQCLVNDDCDELNNADEES